MAAPGLSQPHLRRQQHRDRDICLECPCDDRLDAVADGIRVEDSGLHQQRGRQERPDLGGVSAGAQLPGLVEPEAVLGCSLGDDGRHDARHPDPGEMFELAARLALPHRERVRRGEDRVVGPRRMDGESAPARRRSVASDVQRGAPPETEIRCNRWTVPRLAFLCQCGGPLSDPLRGRLREPAGGERGPHGIQQLPHRQRLLWIDGSAADRACRRAAVTVDMSCRRRRAARRSHGSPSRDPRVPARWHRRSPIQHARRAGATAAFRAPKSMLRRLRPRSGGRCSPSGVRDRAAPTHAARKGPPATADRRAAERPAC